MDNYLINKEIGGYRIAVTIGNPSATETQATDFKGFKKVQVTSKNDNQLPHSYRKGYRPPLSTC
ncbi:hypothetical protein IEQ11_16050 [Lysobacter capsici]|uniref:hypothetical protein n=1 Tax=Lysobacter capsici TaxID=435897 RepID=UPI001785D108|nr:hypothetical protein [Lysobacter capsici]UOF13256.1 hypothetical protein IEQ11_16050 [Lysobacter capsici]